ncbi:DUF202 domain-containing protein [Leifsonia aquatica]|uniref:DUF202 domain-containing protein n=1 Tax=Leifsonia aquatica TaxID=144185 RepID=UPI00382D35A9
MTLFDAGLQPERTALAWTRTALAFLVVSSAAMRVLPETLGVGGLAGAILAVLSCAVLLTLVHQRYRWLQRQLATERGVAASGVPVAAATALALLLAGSGGAVVLVEAFA